ncbi:MAG: hypothetical protein ACI8U4_001107 [Natronomonas sp.]|jgi:hypothetical protein
MSTHTPTPTPTVVVGIGEAGVRMLSAVHDVVSDEDIDERRFKFLAIDSADDMDANFPEQSELNQFTIDAPPQTRWEKMVNETHTTFLRHGDAAASQGGVTRNRPVARALIDDSENFEYLHGFLESNITNFIGNVGETDVDIWLLNSLGGGTGSGAFPIVGAMLHNLTKELKKDDPQLGFNIAGVGTLPQLNRLDEGFFPDARPRHIINAYTALRELQAILEHDYSRSPLEFRIHADEIDLFPGENLPPMQQPPFDRYFLFPVKESEIQNEDTRERMNAIVADLILYFSSLPGIENYPDTDQEYEDDILFTINAAELSFPEATASEYIEVTDSLDEIDTHKRKLDRLEDAYESNRDYLHAVLDVNQGEMPEGTVERRLVSSCQEAAKETITGGDVRYVDEEQLTSDAATVVEETRTEIRNRVEQFDAEVELGDDAVRSAADDVPMLNPDEDGAEPVEPVDTVIEYFYYAQVIEAAKSELERRQYEQRVDEAWAEYRREIRKNASSEEEFERVDKGSADEKWGSLEPFLEYKKDELDEQLDDGGLFSLGFGDSELEEKREDIEDMLGDIRDAKERHDNLNELREEANKRRQTRRDTLQTLRDQFEDAGEAVESEVDDLEHERKKLEHKRDLLVGRQRSRTSLTEFDLDQFAELALENPEALTSDDLEKIKSGEWTLDDLIASGLTSRREILKNFDKLLSRKLAERMSDQSATSPDGLLAPLRHSENSWLDDELRDLSKQTRIEHVTEPMPIADSLAVRLLVTYTPVDLMETSEFGVLYEAHETNDERVVDLLMNDEEREEIEDKYVRFAYPELVDTGENTASEAPEVAED